MLKQFGRFLATGAVNTLAGCAIIFAAQYLTKNPLAANAIGFALGSGIAYYNHSRFTFRQKLNWKRALLYSCIAITCFLINIITLSLLLHPLNAWLAQFIAISVYILANYILLSSLVFRKRRTNIDSNLPR